MPYNILYKLLDQYLVLKLVPRLELGLELRLGPYHPCWLDGERPIQI